MQTCVDDLQSRTFISKRDIDRVNKNLKAQHPNFSSIKLKQLFFEIYHERLDALLYPFNSSVATKIKFILVKSAVQKGDFSVKGIDVVNAFYILHKEEKLPTAMLISWITYHVKASSINAVKSISTVMLKLKPTHTSVLADNTNLSNVRCMQSSLEDIIKANKIIIALTLGIMIGIIGYNTIENNRIYEEMQRHTLINSLNCKVAYPVSAEIKKYANYLQPRLQYKDINEDALKSWLNDKESLLASEPYFSTLVNTAKEYNINPLLLFSITGQEQGFVPSTHPQAKEIANNPFNLYGSWQDYNPTIEESADIAARTIIKLGKDCPDNEDQIKWINQSYAADPNWHNGVSYFLNELEVVASR